MPVLAMTLEDRVAAAIAAVPELRGAPGVERLGGLTNANFNLDCPAGSSVVRIDASDCDHRATVPPHGWTLPDGYLRHAGQVRRIECAVAAHPLPRAWGAMR